MTFFIIVFYEIFDKLRSILSNQNYLLEDFVILPMHISYLHPNIENIIIVFHVSVVSFWILINRATYSS